MRRALYSFLLAETLAAAMAVLALPCRAGQPIKIDSAESIYASASRDYDSVSLKQAAAAIQGQPDTLRNSSRALLALGLIYWRLQLIGYCVNDVSRIVRYGDSALTTLDKAEKAGADAYLAASHRALSSQLLAGLGVRKGMVYGPKSAREISKAKKADSTGYFTLLAEALSRCRAPKFAGGDLAKGVVMLEKTAGQFPDSADVKIHLAYVYWKAGRGADARRCIAPIVKCFPANLLARKVAKDVEK
jgi:hypothetical protein